MKKKIKYIASLAGKACLSFEGIKKYYSTGSINGNENYEEITYDSKPSRANLVVESGDILIAKMQNTNKTTMINEEMAENVYSTGFAALKSETMFNRYLYYLLCSDEFENSKNLYANGTTQVAINEYNLINLKVTYIQNKKCQKIIADFLDDKTRKINEILKDLNKQIEILNKYKKSCITEKITKGLKKNIKMKKTNVAWIGKIPEKWSIASLKHLFMMYAGGDVDEYDFSVEKDEIHKYPIYSNSLENNGLFGYMSKFRFKGKTFTVTGRGDVGKAIARNDEYFPIVRLLVCVPKNNEDNRYFSYCVNSADILGEQTAMAQLTTRKLGSIKVPLPTLKEQQEIADYLDNKCAQINELIYNKQLQIDKLEKYKKSLIYEFVTGKRKVKGAEELYE